MSYSIDFRKKVLLTKEQEKMTFQEVSERFCVGVASVVRWSKNIQPKGKRNKGTIKIDWEALTKDIEKHPDSYQYERAQRFGVSQQGISYALKRLNFSRQKKHLNIQKRILKPNKNLNTK